MSVHISKSMDDQEELNQLINESEIDIDNSKTVDDTVNILIDNIMKVTNGFNDKRTLRASTISALSELLRIKSELPIKRVQAKKMLQDMYTKKIELELKARAVKSTVDLQENTADLLKSIYLKLDQQNIHPNVELTKEFSAACNSIIDSSTKTNNLLDEETKSDTGDEIA